MFADKKESGAESGWKFVEDWKSKVKTGYDFLEAWEKSF
jgi:hypothetical protein